MADPFIAQETQFAGRFKNSVYQTAYECYRPYAFKITVILVIGFLARLFILANANVVGYWVDHFNEFPASRFIMLLTTLSVVGFLLTFVFRASLSRLSCHAISQLYDDVTARVSRYPMSFFDTNPVGRIMTRFTSDYGNVFRLFGGPLSELFSLVFDLASMIILASLANPRFIVLCLIAAVIDFALYRLNRMRMRKERRELSRVRSPSVAHFAETVQGASAVRTFLREPEFFGRFKKLYDGFLNQKIKTHAYIFSFAFQISLSTALLLLITGIWGIEMVARGEITVGALGVAFGFVTLSGNTIQNLFEWISNFEDAFVGLERLDQYLRNPLEKGTPLPGWCQFQTDHPKSPLHRPPTYVWPAQVTLSIENLWLRYNPKLPWVLKNVNLKLNPGEKLGVIGRTGSGKSSLVQGLFHLYPIEKGRITLNGLSAQTSGEKTPDSLSLENFRRAIGVISQDIFLFQGSLKDNLTIDPTIHEDYIVSVLKEIGLWSWFEDRPHRLNWQIEERGRNLSQGEKQMISLARCLLQKAPLIVMDEATSSIDPQTEELMVQATDHFFKDRSQIIIAHRLSTLKNCDKVLWLHGGEVRSYGPTNDVIGLFKENPGE